MEVFEGLECALPLWEHQKKAAKLAAGRESFGFFFEVGAGKTAAAITAARLKYKQAGRVLRTIILSPPVTLKNWENELKMHLPESMHKYVHIIYGPGNQREKELAALGYAADEKGEPFIVITNYESLIMKMVYERLFDLRAELLICDEMHRLKNRTASRTKKAITLADGARFKFGLTGTLMTKDPMDVWAQYRVLDRGQTFGSNFFTFRQKFFYDKNAGMPKARYFPNWQIRPQAFEQFNEKITSTGMVVTKAQCLDLPPLIRQTIQVELSSPQRRAYKQMADDLIAVFNSDEVAVAEFALTKALRLQQIVSGFVKLDNDEEMEFKENPRADALRDLLEDLTPAHKVIVWATFRHNYKTIRDVCKKLRIKAVELTGDVSDKERFENIEAFNNDPEVRVLIGHPGSGGIGVNLTASSVSIFYSRGFSLEHDIQAEARNYRGGSEVHEKITRIDLVAPGTIDEEVVRKLHQKQAISDVILKGMLHGGIVQGKT